MSEQTEVQVFLTGEEYCEIRGIILDESFKDSLYHIRCEDEDGHITDHTIPVSQIRMIRRFNPNKD